MVAQMLTQIQENLSKIQSLDLLIVTTKWITECKVSISTAAGNESCTQKLVLPKKATFQQVVYSKEQNWTRAG